MCRKYQQITTNHNNIKIANCMKTKAYGRKLTPDLESVAKNYSESVKKSHATENEKKLLLTSVISYLEIRIVKSKFEQNVMPEFESKVS